MDLKNLDYVKIRLYEVSHAKSNKKYPCDKLKSFSRYGTHPDGHNFHITVHPIQPYRIAGTHRSDPPPHLS